jgi:hypothetical protein
MPRKFTMTFEPAKKRWRKMYRGKTITISCDALNAPPTREGSYREANEWWEQKLTEIRGKTPPDRVELLIRELQAGRTWLEDQGIKTHYDPTTGMVVESGTEFAHRLARHATPTNRTVGHWVDKFLAMRETEIPKELSIASYDSIRLCLGHFKAWLGPGLPIDDLGADRWIEWYKEIQRSTISVGYKRKRLLFARTFISWLVEQELIPGFASLFAKRYKFGASDKEVPPLTADQVREMVESTSGILKCFLAVMANTGASQKDLADMKPDEYKAGRITRRRSKTETRNTRVVSWKLWKVTRDLIDEFKQEGGSHLFLTQSGKPWVRDELINGKRKKTDSIKSIYRLTKIGIPLKMLRKTSGNLIMHEFNQHIADHFLGHGRDVVDAAYFSREQAELDAAVDWLGKEYRLE